MSNTDVSQIRAGGFTAGIIGLKSVLKDMTGEWAEKPYDQVATE